MTTRRGPIHGAHRARSRDEARVLVLATEYRAGPWALRSLRAAGLGVVGADREGWGGRSRHCLRPERYPAPAREPERFVEWVRRTCRDRDVDVVLPVSEDAARVLAEREPDLGPVIVAGPTREQYRALCDKASLAEWCARAGVAHPDTVIVPPGHGAERWPSLPSVVKPRLSGEDIDCAPALVVADAASRAAAVADLHRAGVAAVVQEMLVGRRWSVHGVRFANGSFVATALRVDRTFPRDAGTSSVMRSVQAPPGLLDACRRLVAAVDYVGPVSMNLIERDGVHIVHDVNLRLSSSIGLSIRSGLDVPALGVAAARGDRPPAGIRLGGVGYVRWDGEVAALRRALRGGAGDAPATVVARLARAAASRGWMVDPWPADPVWLMTRVTCGIRERAAAVRALLGR